MPGFELRYIPLFSHSYLLPTLTSKEGAAVPSFTGNPEQLWRIDQLTDGTYRIMPESMFNSEN
jgi:hypothetical protein